MICIFKLRSHDEDFGRRVTRGDFRRRSDDGVWWYGGVVVVVGRGGGKTVNANECTRAWMPCSARASAGPAQTSSTRQPVFEGWLVLPCATNQRGWSGIGCHLGTKLLSCPCPPATHPSILVHARCPCVHVPRYPMSPSSLTPAPYGRAHTHRIQLCPRTSSSSTQPARCLSPKHYFTSR